MANGAAGLPEWCMQSAPLQLVSFADGGAKADPAKGGPRLAVGETAKRKLLEQAGTSALRVVSVCGLYRTGKSLLLNLLSGTQGVGSGRFAVGDSVQACTAGIWVRASKPAADGTVCLLLDCEGSGNTERDREHDARLFALCVLLSTCVIFNSRGVINESAIQALAVAASLAQHVFRQHKDRSPGEDIAPWFVWVLRDFVLALEDPSGQEITEQQYLEQALAKPAAREAERRADLREAREKITDLFPHRDCVTLVRPVDDEQQLQELNELPLGQLRPKFLSKVEELRQKVLGECPPLRSEKGEAADGRMFIALLEAHVEAINTGAIPELGSIWQHVTHQECGRALDEALRMFSEEVMSTASVLPLDDQDMAQALERCQKAAALKFMELALGDEASQEEYRSELDKGMTARAERLRKENDDVASRSNESWLQRHWDAAVEESLKPYRRQHDAGSLPPASCEEAETLLKTKVAELQTAYDQECAGPSRAREQCWKAYLERRGVAAAREIDSWRGRSSASATADAAGKKAGEEERAKLEAEGASLAAKIRKEGEESQTRIEALQASQAAITDSLAVQVDFTGQDDAPARKGKCCVIL